MKNKKSRYKGIIPLFLFLISVLLNIVAWNSSEFCDYYTSNIFPYLSMPLAYLTSKVPFSVGEGLVVLFVVLLCCFLFEEITYFTSLLIKKCRIKKEDLFLNVSNKNRNKLNFTKVHHVFGLCICYILSFVSLVMTLNCSILYHCSKMNESNSNYISASAQKKVYTVEQLMEVRNHVVEQSNLLAKIVKRDNKGNMMISQDIGSQAIIEMKRLSSEFPKLDGFYTIPKPLASSSFISQQYMQGYYFPFTIEANYNDVMAIIKRPATMCHELAHTKGYIYEDEANFIGFLACVRSENKEFQYSGYLSVLKFLDNAFQKAINYDKDIYNSQVKISSQVKKDNVFLTEENWEQVERKSLIKTAYVKKTTQSLVNSSLKLNGIKNGKISYSDVVGLLLDYYFSGFSSF